MIAIITSVIAFIGLLILTISANQNDKFMPVFILIDMFIAIAVYVFIEVI